MEGDLVQIYYSKMSSEQIRLIHTFWLAHFKHNARFLVSNTAVYNPWKMPLIDDIRFHHEFVLIGSYTWEYIKLCFISMKLDYMNLEFRDLDKYYIRS